MHKHDLFTNIFSRGVDAPKANLLKYALAGNYEALGGFFKECRSAPNSEL
mgnify:CR=1 FL=1